MPRPHRPSPLVSNLRRSWWKRQPLPELLPSFSPRAPAAVVVTAGPTRAERVGCGGGLRAALPLVPAPTRCPVIGRATDGGGSKRRGQRSAELRAPAGLLLRGAFLLAPSSSGGL